LPQTPLTIFALMQKSKQKKHLTRPTDTLSNWRGKIGIEVFDFACFTRKISRLYAENF
jgi:hypothetical protein